MKSVVAFSICRYSRRTHGFHIPIAYQASQKTKAACKTDPVDSALKEVKDVDVTTRKSTPRDPNKPKQGLSAFMLFSKAMRWVFDFRISLRSPKFDDAFARDSAELKEKNPDKKATEIAKLLGESWKAIDIESKKKYTEEADAEKAKFEEALKEYYLKIERGEIDPPVTPEKTKAADPPTPKTPKRPKAPRKTPEKKTATAVTPDSCDDIIAPLTVPEIPATPATPSSALAVLT
ncbi:Non-histone chromosomal protein 6, partial [Gonapodya sp. JEL0774]